MIESYGRVKFVIKNSIPDKVLTTVQRVGTVVYIVPGTQVIVHKCKRKWVRKCSHGWVKVNIEEITNIEQKKR